MKNTKKQTAFNLFAFINLPLFLLFTVPQPIDEPGALGQRESTNEPAGRHQALHGHAPTPSPHTQTPEGE